VSLVTDEPVAVQVVGALRSRCTRACMYISHGGCVVSESAVSLALRHAHRDVGLLIFSSARRLVGSSAELEEPTHGPHSMFSSQSSSSSLLPPPACRPRLVCSLHAMPCRPSVHSPCIVRPESSVYVPVCIDDGGLVMRSCGHGGHLRRADSNR
jgi:hypothetical protein